MLLLVWLTRHFFFYIYHFHSMMAEFQDRRPLYAASCICRAFCRGISSDISNSRCRQWTHLYSIALAPPDSLSNQINWRRRERQNSIIYWKWRRRKGWIFQLEIVCSSRGMSWSRAHSCSPRSRSLSNNWSSRSWLANNRNLFLCW